MRTPPFSFLAPATLNFSRMPMLAAWLLASAMSILPAMARADDIAEDMTTHSALHREITTLDARISDAYNHCRIQPLKNMFAGNVELYFADRGVTRRLSAHTDTLRRSFCGKFRREAPSSDQQVHPLPDYGAIQIGTQSFCAIDSKPCRGQRMHFMAIWRRLDGEWKITRLVRYGYTPTP